VAHTVKGKGVDFMEDKLAWHYKSPNAEELANAITQLNDTRNENSIYPTVDRRGQNER
jgi:transketolase